MLKDKNTLKKEFKEGQKVIIANMGKWHIESVTTSEATIKKIDEECIILENRRQTFEYEDGFFRCREQLYHPNDLPDEYIIFPTKEDYEKFMQRIEIIYKITALEIKDFEKYSLLRLRYVAKLLDL